MLTEGDVRWPQPCFFPTRSHTLFLRSQNPLPLLPALTWGAIVKHLDSGHTPSATPSPGLSKKLTPSLAKTRTRGKDYYSICKLQIFLSSVNSLYLLTKSQRRNLIVTKMRKLNNKTVNIVHKNRNGQFIIPSLNQTWTGCLDLKSVSQVWQLQLFRQVHMPMRVRDIWLQGLVTHNLPKSCNLPDSIVKSQGFVLSFRGEI